MSAGQECVGCTGTGNFTQSGGTNVVGTLFLSNNPISAGGSGTYSLSGSGLLSAGQEYIGYSGTGNFTQSGGTNAVGTLFLGVGVPVNGSGTYSLSGSGLLSAGQEYVGFVNGTGNFTQSGGTNAVGALYLGASSGTYSLNGGMLITSSLSYGWANTPFNFGGGTLQADSSFTTALPMTLTGSGGDATVDTAGYTVILGGSISGPGGLTKTDSGTLVLAAANTYSGDTLISGGTLQLTNALALQNSTFNTSGSGSMNFSDLGAATLGGLSGSGNLALINTANAAVALTTGGNNATTIYSGMLSGTGSLNKTGSGALVLTGYNTYTGGTTVAGGILQFNGDSTVPSGGTIAIQSGAAVALAQTGNYSTVTGWLGSGQITPDSAGALALIADSSEGINMGGYASLSLGASGNVTYSGTLTPSGSTYNLGGGGGTLTFTPAMTGATSLNVSGPGVVALTGSNTYGGLTTISGGTLQLGSGGTTGSIDATSGVTDNSVLAFNRSDSVTFAPAVSGSGSLTQMGPGTVALTGSNTYTGGTAISGGTLQLGDGANINGSVAGNIVNSAHLTFANPSAQSFTGTISGSGGLTKTAAGVLILAGSNLYSGGTEVDNGTLAAANGSNGSATGSGNVTISGGTLASGAAGGSISGGVLPGSAASTIAPGGIGSVGDLTIGSLITASNMTLNFDLTTPEGSGDLLTIINGLTVAPNTAITFGTNPNTVGEYRLIGGNFGTPVLSYFVLPVAPMGMAYSLSTTVDPGFIDLTVVPEPSTFALLGAGAIGLLGYAWRRRQRA